MMNETRISTCPTKLLFLSFWHETNRIDNPTFRALFIFKDYFSLAIDSLSLLLTFTLLSDVYFSFPSKTGNGPVHLMRIHPCGGMLLQFTSKQVIG